MTREAIENLILSKVQPLIKGVFEKTTALKAQLVDLVPTGLGDHFQVASPYGLVSRPRKGVEAFVLNLFGKTQSPIIVAQMHRNRPIPDSEGEVILYCSDESGGTHPIKIILKPDGTLRIEATSKIQLVCDDVEIGEGALENVLNGETFQAFFNQHQHQGNLGVPTGPPIVLSDAGHLSAVVKAKK